MLKKSSVIQLPGVFLIDPKMYLYIVKSNNNNNNNNIYA